MTRAPDLSLPALVGRRLPPADRDEVHRWLHNPAQLTVDRDRLEVACHNWLAATPKADTIEHNSLLRHLRASRPLTYNATWRERQGGRRYCYFVDGHAGPLVLSRTGYDGLGQGRVLLQATPKLLRPALLAPPGHQVIVADISTAFLAIAATASGDTQLRDDLRSGDIHQRVGDALLPGVDSAQMRDLGKIINNGLVGGMTPFGLREELRKQGGRCSLESAKKLHERWWARYSTFRDFVADIDQRLLLSQRGYTIEALDGRCFRFCPAEVDGVTRKGGERRYRIRANLDHGQRSVVSSIWRSIEGSIIDRSLQRLQPVKADVGLSLVLPLYDALVMAAPEDQVEAASELLRAQMTAALADAGIEAGLTVTSGPSWGSQGGRS